MDGDDRPHDGDDVSTDVIDEAIAVLAAHSGLGLDDAARALRADAAAFGVPVCDVAQDVVDVAEATRCTGPGTLASLLESIGPWRPDTARPRH